MQDIQTVVYRCQQGELDAFTALFNHYQNRVYDIACAILCNKTEAEDAVQDTFLAVFQKINGYKGQSAFETWLIAIAVNQCRIRLRKRKIRQFLSLEQLSRERLLGARGGGEDVADIIHQRQRRQTMWDWVDKLDDRLRLPLILRYRYALPCGEIAIILNRRQSTIYQHLHEGRKSLEKMARQQAADSPAPSVEIAS